MIAECFVTPGDYQVIVKDKNAAEFGEWMDEDNPYVSATEQSISIGTGDTLAGPVRVQIFGPRDSDPLAHLIFEGDFLLTDSVIEIGSPGQVDNERIDVGLIGYVAVRVFIEPLTDPDTVSVCFRSLN